FCCVTSLGVNVRMQSQPTLADGRHRSTTVKIVYFSVPARCLMRIRAALSAALLLVLGVLIPGRPAAAAATTTPIQIYGAWHCSNDACTWATVRDMANFDTNNHWLIDRGDGRPSVNLVILSFVNPLRLLNQTTDAGDLNGVPRGMTSAVVNYFT